MSSLFRACLFAALPFLWVTFSTQSVLGQAVVRTSSGGKIVTSRVISSSSLQEMPVASPASASVPAAAANATSEEGKEAEKPFDERRMEALLKAKIDRSLPTVLKSWSGKDKPKETKKKTENKKDKSVAAKVANLFEGLVVLEFENKPAFRKDELFEVHAEEKIVGVVKVFSVEGLKVTGKFQAPKETEGKTETPGNEKLAAANPEAKAGDTKAPATSKSDEATSNGSAQATETTHETAEAESKPDSDDAQADAVAVTEKSDEDSPNEASTDAPAVAAEKAPAWESLAAGTEVTIKKPDDGSGKKAAEEARIKTEVAQWSTMVTLGQWTEVKAYLATLKENDADKLYAHLLSRLAATPGASDRENSRARSSSGNEREKPLSNFLSPEDILLITDAAPKPWKVSVTGNKKFSGVGGAINGKWEGKITIGGPGLPPGIDAPDISVVLNIQVSGNSVSGSIEVNLAGLGAQEERVVSFDGGTWDGKTGALTFSATSDGQMMNADMVVEGGKMTGTMSADGPGDITMKFAGELVEPSADQPEGLEKGEDTEVASDATPEFELPGGVKLPPGMTVDDMPPELREQLVKQLAGKEGDKKKKASSSGKSHIPALARLVRKSNTDGFDLSSFIDTIKKGAYGIGGTEKDSKRIAADLFLKAGLSEEVEHFLPTLDDAVKENDVISLKMWSQLSLNKYRSKQIAKWLGSAWQANMALSTLEDSEQTEKDAAMANLIELSPKVDRGIGEKWLDESFTQSPERGMKILTNLGTKSSTMARRSATVSEEERLKLLRLQNGAAEKLLKVAPELADQWSDALTLLADTWLKEADIAIQYGSSNSGGGYWQYDQYGNSYWASDDQYSRYRNRNQPQPIRIGDVLEIAPSEQWRKRVRPTLNTQMQRIFASLHLHVNEEEKAFPWIEKVASENPKEAKKLVSEFLQIWTKNHDPNSDKNSRNRYVYFYGFDEKADAIPLTRSKQQRNLEELQGWVDRIRAMKIEDLDENLLANAFTTCHSSAEVYDLDRVKSVFGDLGSLKPKTIAAICEKMRANLASNWRNIRNQEEKKTNRRLPEVQQEVLRGYRVASDMAKEALKTSPDNWQLNLSLACLMFDQNAYSQTVQKTSEFSEQRDAAFLQFQLAAEKYAAKVAELEKDEQTTEAFDRWFYAALGAVDLGKITNKTSPVPKQYPLIRDAIAGLPGSLGESHMSMFANNMFSRMNPIKPEIKFRYLRGGFAIVGQHPRAWEARGLYDYYRDLVSELKLVANLDGDHQIGDTESFGVYVNLEHTSEIERESGGFAKYLQNQNSMMYAYNYGRPTEDYRDKFTDAVKEALADHFEVQSITFQSPEGMQSRPGTKEGWRVTPYAYLLLKAKGPEVDRVPSLKLDMDFLDTSGYVVIPIESPEVVVDATSSSGLRPVSDLKLTQTLDERQAAEGKLIVEVTASAKGLVPPLEEIVNLDGESFEIVSVDDQGVLPARFDKETDDVQIISERSWSVEYRTKENRAAVTEFSFPDAKISDAELKFKRYEDVDLVDADPTVSLERTYSNAGWSFLYWLIPLVAVGLFAMAAVIFGRTGTTEEELEKFAMPADVNPFTVLTLLRDIKTRNGIANEQAVKLDESIREVERNWFSKEENGQEDLEEIARTWLQEAK